MKKFLKVFLIIVFIPVLAGAGYFVYIKFSSPEKIEPISLVPADALFMIETNNLTAGWDEIRKTELWKNLFQNESFDSISNQLLSIDSMMHNNKVAEMMLKGRKLMLTAHMISGLDYDFIFYIDVEYSSKLSGLFKSLQMLNFKVSDNIYKGYKVFEIVDLESNTKVYLSVINNVLVGSLSKLLLEDVILRKEEQYWVNDHDFQIITKEISAQTLINFYFNFERLPKFIQKYTSDDTDLVVLLSKVLKYSASNLNIQDNLIELDGSTLLQENASYLSVFDDVSAQRSMCYEILPSNTAFYMTFTFDDFNKAYNNLLKELEYSNKDDYKSYTKGIRNLEVELEIDIEEHLLNWIGNEISIVKTNPKFGSRNEDIILMIHSDDIELAKQSLQNMLKQLEETAPIKFKSKNYKNYEIQFLNIKGVFKLLFGDLFESIEKPYYTVVDDFVIFSNSDKTIIDLINFYLKGKTLSHNESFNAFKDNFNIKSNVSVFIQTPHIFRHIYQNSNNNFKEELLTNKDLYLSFNHIGLQLDVNDKLLKTRMIANYDENTLYNLVLEQLEMSSAEELFNLEYENLEFKFEIPEEQQLRKGSVKLKYENEVTQYEGKVRNGKADGLWRSYFNNGNIKSAVNYEEGKANGEAIFYYDAQNEPIKAEVIFDNDEIIDIYKEFYINGNKKAVLQYDDNKMNGEALLYYENGVLKIKGEYKDGLKTGKWEYFRENGEIYEKEKWKKGSKK